MDIILGMDGVEQCAPGFLLSGIEHRAGQSHSGRWVELDFGV